MRTLRRRYGHGKGAGLNGAVDAVRLYLGSVDYADLRAQQRFYNRAWKAVTRVAATRGMAEHEAWKQIESEARRRGIIRPTPGQHL